MDTPFSFLSFFAGPRGPVLIGAVVALIIVAWDWRIALVGLFIVQVGVVSASAINGEIPSEWAGVMIIVMGLACLILGISAQRITRTTTLYQSGTWQLRALLVALVYMGWELSGFRLSLPGISPQQADLFIWLAMCVLVILGLSENPLFSTVAFLLWLIPCQVVTAVIVDSPSLVALIGMLTLLLALAGSYLVLVEQVADETKAPVVTDISFPGEVSTPAATRVIPHDDESWAQWLRRQTWGDAVIERTRQVLEKRRP